MEFFDDKMIGYATADSTNILELKHPGFPNLPHIGSELTLCYEVISSVDRSGRIEFSPDALAPSGATEEEIRNAICEDRGPYFLDYRKEGADFAIRIRRPTGDENLRCQSLKEVSAVLDRLIDEIREL
jgi:hypothetical protein